MGVGASADGDKKDKRRQSSIFRGRVKDRGEEEEDSNFSFPPSDTIESAVAKEMDVQKDRYKPERMDVLMEQTHFSKCELKYLYQCFKQNCPSGYVTRDQFVAIFRQFFVMHKKSDAGPYAELVFNTFDDDGNGRISFSEFAVQLSMFNKGTLDQRIDWLFDLYDKSRRGYIQEDEYMCVCSAMYALVGVHYYKEKHFPIKLKRHLKHQFQKLDKNRDGKITRSEFIDGCKDDTQICESLERLRTVW
ncbi:hypothetical protein PRIPAC_96149 [Pristionchus pacificus]|uniref:HLH domain-containing protein n=1 Tax=Pristionchus pacificus TaxID=54126 RepID=A0A2A6CU44_PRIPA|nr:hypothetical protein PRIPAC_96149 [Pristionchus pacificus]|eukprot:PDM81638.1 HLH domain-containing protein [Pristionchus pacificus]